MAPPGQARWWPQAHAPAHYPDEPPFERRIAELQDQTTADFSTRDGAFLTGNDIDSFHFVTDHAGGRIAWSDEI